MRRLGWLLAVMLGAASSLVVLPQGVAGADTVTFTSTTLGTTGSTAPFSMTGEWTMAWSYHSCVGGNGYFGVTVTQPTGDLVDDTAPNQLGAGGSGTDYYFDTGTFHLTVISGCQWSITVQPSGASPSGTPATFTTTQIGTTGSTPQFTVTAPWTMAWSYDCSGYGTTGYFSANSQQWTGTTFNIGPNELGMRGSGTDTYYDSGVFNLVVLSECSWSITVNGAAGAPPPSPTAPPVTATATATASVVGMAATPTGGGYWEVASDGGIFTFGNAGFYGSMGGHPLNKPVVGMAPDAATGGYWEVASDGGIFSFNAPFYGSEGGKPLNQPVLGMTANHNGTGYRLAAYDGGIFTFGAVNFYGSEGGHPLNAPVVGMATTGDNGGYWEVARDGGIFTFGDAQFHGSRG